MSYEDITTFRLSPLSRQRRYTHFGRPCLATVAGKSQLDYTGTPIRFFFHFVWLGTPGISRSHWVTHNVNSPGRWVSSRHLICLKQNKSQRTSWRHKFHWKLRETAPSSVTNPSNGKHTPWTNQIQKCGETDPQMNMNRHCDGQPWRWK
jgi:hypothetical protein